MGLSRREIMARIEEFEREGRFDEHVDPVDYSLVKPLDTFPYKRTPWQKFVRLLEQIFIVKPFIWYHTRFNQHLKIEGKQNLKGLGAAIATCNHVDIFDCLAAIRALKSRTLVITAADFNNRNDFLGEMMRAGGVLPFGNTMPLMRKFNGAVTECLKRKKGTVMFYPEQALWYHYRKVRPLKRGAFHYAMIHNAPVLPIFISFRESKKKDKEGLPKEYLTLHILPPIYARQDLDDRSNIEYLQERTQQVYQEAYSKIYGAGVTQ